MIVVHTNYRGLHNLCSDYWSIIIPYMSPNGPAKYTCKAFYEHALQAYHTKKWKPDDTYSETNVLDLRYDLLNDHELKRAVSHSLNSTKDVRKFIATIRCKRVSFNMIVRPLAYNMNINTKIRIEIIKGIELYGQAGHQKECISRATFMVTLKELKSLAINLYRACEHKALHYIVFEKFYNVHKDLIGRRIRLEYLVHSKYTIALIEKDHSNAAKLFEHICQSHILAAIYKKYKDNPEIIDPFIKKFPAIALRR